MNNKYSNLKIAWFPKKLQSFKDEKLTAPICVRIKPTNKCCHNCYFCVYNFNFSSMHESANKIDEIPLNKMLEILADLRDMGVKAVTYSGGGEPLFHKDIIEILQKTLDCGLDLSMLTNGQLLDGTRAEKMIHAKWIRVSMDYWNSDMFGESRKINKTLFHRIISNIKNFSAAIKGASCDLGVNYIITRDNYKTLQEAFNLLVSTGVDNIRFSPLWVPNFFNYHDPIKSTVKNQLSVIYKKPVPGVTVYDTYNIVPEVTTRTYSRCYFLQVVPVIAADQKIYNCHNKSYDPQGIIGSITDKKFSDVWFSKETQDYIKNFRPDILCNHQCANDQKNKYIHEILGCSSDNYI